MFISCLVNFGIAPQSCQELVDGTKQSPFISVSFDESLNDILQKEQMDVIIRFWNAIAEKIEVHYMDLKFLKRPNAIYLLNELLEAMESLTFFKKLIQLSMDQPNTNWEVFRLLKEHQNKEEEPSLFRVGNCSLHVMHGAFQIGNSKTKWNIGKVLTAVWQLFHESPARRDIYVTVSESDVLP